MTELASGSVWNTMPAHVHDRRMEVYFYFEVPQDQAVCHFMGATDETRHLWMANEQAVISPLGRFMPDLELPIIPLYGEWPEKI